MKQFRRRTHKLHSEAGQGLVEYAILLILVGIAVVAIVALMQPAIGDVFSRFVAQAPVAPPSLLNYTPPPTFTITPTQDPNASPTPLTPIPSITLAASHTPTATNTPVPSNTPTSTSTATATATVPCAYGPHTVPTNGTVRVQMENFRCGGAGVAFFEVASDGGPGSSPYRSDVGAAGPDLETAFDTGGGYNVGWVADGEWLEYEVIAPQTLGYTFVIRNASISTSNPRIRITVSQGALQYNSVVYTLGPTNGWQDWTNDVIGPVTLFAGSNIVRITMETGWANYNYFEIQPYTPTPTPTPVTPTATPIPTNTPAALQLYLEAESGNGLNGQWDIDNSGSASGGQYITWDGNSSGSNPPSNQQVTYSFTAPSAGLYRVYLRVDTDNSGNHDSVWVRIDGATVNQSQNITRSNGWVMFNNMVLVNTWTWDQVHNAESGNSLVQFYLPAGSHTLRLGYREPGTWIDRIFITNTGNLP
ncbi:MAG: carbohydrate-binding protein [Anaerolineaceae bacterium]|nr:carbohydrate-binding protein [Anaerolineaceae bacterium]